MQINNSPLIVNPFPAEPLDKQSQARPPVVYQPQLLVAAPASASVNLNSTLVNAVSDAADARQARFVRSFASIDLNSAQSDTSAGRLPLQQYLQNTAPERNQPGSLFDATV